MSNPLNCPHCSHAFQNKGQDRTNNRNYNARYPLLLQCGHSACYDCVEAVFKVQKSYQCKICHVVTDLPNGPAILPCSEYLLNKITVKDKPQQNLFMTPSFKRSNSQSGNSPRGSSNGFCNECRTGRATSHCDSCSANFCSPCWDKVHNSLIYMKNHKPTPLLEDIGSTDSEMECKAHKRALEFYCDDDDQLACSYCAVMGPHKGHALVEISQKNEECSSNLKEAVSSGIEVWNRLKFTQKEISSVQIETKKKHIQIRNTIQMEFMKIFGLLELREQELLKQFDEVSMEDMSNIDKMLLDVSQNVKNVLALIKNGNKALGSYKSSVNGFLIEKKLMSSKDLPSYLVLSSDAASPDSSVSVKFESLAEEIAKFGKLEVNKDKERGYRLVDEANLPETYTKEVLAPIEDINGASDGDETASSVSESIHIEYVDFMSQSSVSERVSGISGSTQRSSVSQLRLSTPDPLQYFRNEDIHITHIVNPSEFYVKRTKDIKNLRVISDILNKYRRSKNNSGSAPKEVSVGELFLAQYQKDNLWYRARIKSIEPNCINGAEQVTVFFIDFGNCQKIPQNRLRKIMDPKLLQFPAMVWKCEMYDLLPYEDKWSNDAIKVFYNLTANKTLSMTMMEKTDHSLIVDLSQVQRTNTISEKPTSIRECLVFMSFARFSSAASDLSTVRVSKQKIYNEEAPELGGNCMVALCHINDVTSFFVQKQGAKSKKLVQLMMDLQTVYKHKHPQDLLLPAKGVFCCAQFSEDGKWYRAQVISDIQSSEVQVKYVDYGNTEFVKVWTLKKLLEKHLDLPAQAIHCSLADVGPESIRGEWSSEAAQFLASIGGDKKLKLTVNENEDNLSHVILNIVMEDREININSLLVQKNYAVSTGPCSAPSNNDIIDQNAPESLPQHNNSFSPPSQVQPSRRVRNRKLQNLRKKEIRKQLVTPTSPPALVTAPIQPENERKSGKAKNKKSEYIPIIMSHVDSPTQMYFRLRPELTGQENKLKIMMDGIQAEYSYVVESGNIEWNEKDACCVKNPKDKLWYRGRISQILDDAKQFKVLLVDYGQHVTVDSSNITILQEEFQIDPAFCVRCHLVGIKAAGDGKTWSTIACEYLIQLIDTFQDQIYFIHNKQAEKVEGSIAVNLYVQETVAGGALEGSKKFFVNVAEKLVDQGLALPIRNLQTSNSWAKQVEKETEDEENEDETLEEDTSEDKTLEEEDNDEDDTSSSIEQPQMSEELKQICLLSWKPAIEVSQKVFKCKPSYIDDSARVYLYDLIKADNNLRVLSDALQMKFADTKPQPHDLYWTPGQICAARFHIDKKWYRAQVIAIQDKGVKVRFVDYGNEDVLSPEELRKDVIMTELPIQSTCCELYGLQPITEDGKWPVKVLDFMHKTIVDKKCIVTIENFPVTNQLPKISLVVEPDMCLSKLLLDAKCAMEKEEYDVQVENVSYVDTNESVLSSFPTANIPAIDEIIPVVVTQMAKDFQISIQRLEDKSSSPSNTQFEANTNYHRFLDIVKQMQENAASWPQLKDVHEGSIFCGQYTVDDTWYRAEVLKTLSGNEYLVCYVDYGNFEVISTDRMKVLPAEIVDFPVQAITCSLYQLAACGSELSDETKARMIKILFNSEQAFYAKIKCQAPEVKIDLLVKDNEGNLKLAYQSLIDDGLIALVRERLPQEFL